MTQAAAMPGPGLTPDAPHAFEAQCRAAMALALRDVDQAVIQTADLVAQAGADPTRRVLARVARSHALCYAGDFRGAVAALDEVGGDAAAIEPRLVALLRNASVQPLMRLGRLDEALAAGQAAVEASRRAGEELGIAKALLGLGAVQRALGRPGTAAATLAEAERFAGPGSAVAAAAASNRAECLLDDDRFGEALAAFTGAAEAFEALEHRHAAAIARGNRADVLGRLGRIDEAIGAFEAARGAFEGTGAALDAARLACEEAEMLAGAGALRSARDRYAAALPVLEAANAGNDLHRARVALASVLLELRDTTGAQHLLGQVPLTTEAEGVLAAETLLGLARCDMARGAPEQGLARLDAALEGVRSRPARLARALLLRADMLLALGDAAAARDAAEQAAAAAARAGLAQLAPLSRLARARCVLALGDARAAADDLAAAAHAADTVLAGRLTPAALSGLAHLYGDVYRLLARVSLNLGRTDAADAILRADDASGRADQRRDERHAPDQPASTPAEARLRERLDIVTESLTRLAVQAGAFPGARQSRDLADLQAEASVLNERLGGVARAAPAPPLTTDTLQRALPPRTALLHWFDDDARLSALLMTRDAAVVCRAVADPRAITAQCRRLAFIAERAAARGASDDKAWGPLLAGLRHALIEPVFAAAATLLDGVDSLLVRADGAATTIPWLGVLAPHPGNPGLTHRVISRLRDICHAPPLSAGPAPRAVFIAADDGTLPAAVEEATACAAAWPDSARQLGGTAAQALALARDADVLHLATHGVFVPDRPSASRLWIGDRWVAVRELAQAIKPGALVMLAACHAGRSGGLAEDRAAIPSSLLAAGAAAVIAPIWPLGDASALAVFSRVHARLAACGTHGVNVARVVADAVAEAVAQRGAGVDALGLQVYGGVRC